MSHEQLKFELYEDALLNPLHGHELSELESFVASLLLEASSELPIGLKTIIFRISTHTAKQIDERKAKDIIRTLRRNHAFPILARRKQPAGYFWCASAEQMKEFIESFRSQALDELHTLSKIVKKNYPALAGQLKLTEVE